MILFRVLSAQPQTDGEHWVIRGQFHNDDWYTDAYGQNPAPFYRNPQLDPRDGPPYPWHPGGLIPAYSSTDPLFPSRDAFSVGIDSSSFPAQVQIGGNIPVNLPQLGEAPQAPLQATTGNTGGTIKPGRYLVAFSNNDFIGPVSRTFITAVVPAGTNTNTVTVSNIVWDGPSVVAAAAYAGPTSIEMVYAGRDGEGHWTGSSPDGNGNPTVVTFTSIPVDSYGLPDLNFKRFKVEEHAIVHGGVWGDGIADVSGAVISFPSASWTTNQWNGYILSLYYRPLDPLAGTNVALQPVVNAVVASNTANTLTMTSTSHGFHVGDVVVMRAKTSIVTDGSVGDPNFVNSYAPSGLNISGEEKGKLIQIIAGTGAWQPPKVIDHNSADTFFIDGLWDQNPDSTSVWIVIDPTVAYEYKTAVLHSDGDSGLFGTIATTKAISTIFQSLLIQVATTDEAGNQFPMRYQPFREVYIPTQNAANDGYFHIGTSTVNRSITADIDAVQTTMALDSAAGLPGVPFLVLLTGSECVRVTAITGTGVTAMDRAFNGTTAASHANGDTAVIVKAPVNLDLGLNQALTLNGAHVTILAPTGSGIVAGSAFSLYLDQDSTGSRPAPEYVGGAGGYVSDTYSQISVDPTPSTRTFISFTYHGTNWAQDTNSTGNAIT